MTIEHPIEDEVGQLARRVEKARGRLAYQFDPALTEALSEDELHAERDLAEKIRGQDRSQRWKQAQAAAGAADRARQTTEEIEKADIRDLLVARKAIAAQRRESSPHAKLASLYRHRSWSLRALAGVVGAGMLWSAVNVQQNIAPTGPSDPLYWFSYLIEAMISVCLIVIMIGTNKVSEWGVADNRGQVVAAEIALLALTVGLNTYPYVRGADWFDAAVHAVAPVMIGVALLIHDAASARYGLAIARATDQIRDIPDPAEVIRNRLPDLAAYRPISRDMGELTAPVETDRVPVAPPQPDMSGLYELADPLEDLEADTADADTADAEIVDVVEDEEVTAPARPTAKPAARPTAPARKPAAAAEPKVTARPAPEPAPVVEPPAPTKPMPVVRPATAEVKPVVAESPAPAPVAADDADTVAEKRAAGSSRSGLRKVVPGRSRTATAAATAAETRPAKTAKVTAAAKPDLQVVPAPDPIHDTGQFRIAELLEQELAELQAERRRARTSRGR